MNIIKAKTCAGGAGWRIVALDAAGLAALAEKAEALLARSGTFVLITLDGSGNPSAKAMSLKDREAAGLVWFATHASSTHALQAERNPRATVFFQDTSTWEGLMIAGRLVRETRRDRMQKCWRAFYTQTFPGGIDDPEYRVYRFEAKTGNYTDSGTSAELVF